MFKRSLHNYDDEIEGDMLTSVESVQKGEVSVLINVAKLQKKEKRKTTHSSKQHISVALSGGVQGLLSLLEKEMYVYN